MSRTVARAQCVPHWAARACTRGSGFAQLSSGSSDAHEGARCGSRPVHARRELVLARPTRCEKSPPQGVLRFPGANGSRAAEGSMSTNRLQGKRSPYMAPRSAALPRTWPTSYPLHRPILASEARRLDAAADERGLSGLVLMEHAARGVAAVASALAPRRAGPIAVLCGPGNNGGDGYAAARQLGVVGPTGAGRPRGADRPPPPPPPSRHGSGAESRRRHRRLA